MNDREQGNRAENPILQTVSRLHDTATPEGVAGLIPFDEIEPSHVVPAFQIIIEAANAGIDELAEGSGGGFDEVMGELDRVTRRVATAWSPISHLNNVRSTEEFRAAYGEVLPELTQFWSRVINHGGLYQRIRAFADSVDRSTLTPLQDRHLSKVVDEFERAGAALPDEEKARLEEMRIRLSTLSQSFQENLLEETAAFAHHVTSESELVGLPEATLSVAAAKAKERGLEGWVLGLDMPTVQAVLKLAENRGLRETIHSAYADRCAGGERNNVPLIEEILTLRGEMAQVLGFSDFPDFRLGDMMAKSGQRVRSFLDDLIEGTEPYFRRDAALLEQEAQDRGLSPLEPWDVSYLVEKMRQEQFDLEEEALRPWFPLPAVQAGLFGLAERLFGFTIEEIPGPGRWHEDVQVWAVLDEQGTRRAVFYSDWFPRPEKRQGAWMDSFLTGGPTPDGEFIPHLAFMGGNFSQPTDGKPALLTHREVQTLFHEFGHLLHHASSQVEIPGRAGINVAWDWVEVPSQLMENWTWEKEALDLFARHWETSEPLPEASLHRMLRARRFMGGWNQFRQLSFANLDLELHRTYAQAQDEDDGVMAFSRNVLRGFVPSDQFVRRTILPGFSHLFAGGYASAYYSYLWSETLEADAFSRFEAEGVMNPTVGRSYVDTILSQGDAQDPEELFQAFMGRDVDRSALLTRNLGPLEGNQDE